MNSLNGLLVSEQNKSAQHRKFKNRVLMYMKKNVVAFLAFGPRVLENKSYS